MTPSGLWRLRWKTPSVTSQAALTPPSTTLPQHLKTSYRSGLNLITRLKSTRTLVPMYRASEARDPP